MTRNRPGSKSAAALLLCLSMALAGCDGRAATGDGAAQAAAGQPLEREAPNAPDQEPQFPGQTRAPGMASGVELDVKPLGTVKWPWGFEFLPDGRILVTEQPGRLRIMDKDGNLSQPVAGVPKVDYEGQGGLLDVALDPDFPSNRLVYFSYAEPLEGGENRTALARGRLVTDGDGPRLENLEVLFRQDPAMESRLHFGSRIAFAPDGTLFLGLGERSILAGRVQAQDLASHLGKVVRLNPDGSVPKDNPFLDDSKARDEIWSYGHRNIQSAAIHPETGELWIVEHGARGGDELNQPEAGKNYGWPVITYGIEYSGKPIGDSLTAKEGMEQPVYYWDPVIAPSGMLFYTGNLFPEWKGDLFIGGLASSKLIRLKLEDGKVVGEEWLLQDLGERIRDVRQGSDGAIYVATDSPDGQILRLAPKK